MEAKAQGGDRRSQRIEAHSAFVLNTVAEHKDITLAEMQELRAERGEHFGLDTTWRFLDRHTITLKRRRRTRPNKVAPM